MSFVALAWCADVQPSLSDRALRVLLELARMHNHTTGRCDPKVGTLADRVGLDRRTVLRGLSELRDAGHLTVERRGPTSSQYDLHIPGWSPAPVSHPNAGQNELAVGRPTKWSSLSQKEKSKAMSEGRFDDYEHDE